MDDYTTRLDPFEEIRFKDWFSQIAKKNGLNPNPDDPLHYYDYRGAYKSGIMPSSNQHWPDTFKTPGHPTFSNESMYATGINRLLAGRWEGNNYIPPQVNINERTFVK